MSQFIPTLRSLKITYGGYGYGRIITQALPTAEQPERDDRGSVIRIEQTEIDQLACLWCDVFDFYGHPQPWLEIWERRNLARWILRYGVQEFGRMDFCREAARQWVKNK